MTSKLQTGFPALGIKFCISLLVSIVTLAMMVPGIAGVQPVGQQPGGGLVITGVDVDFINDTLCITGEDFDFGPGPLIVSLDSIGDITGYCTLADSQTIDCDFSSNAGLPADGDYLLIVANGAGQSQSDEFDLGIERTFFNVAPGDLVYTVRATKGTESGGSAVANNKFVDVTCNAGDILISGGIQLGGSGAGGNTPAGNQDIADHITILENRPLGGVSAWRVRAHETPVNGLGSRVGWKITAWGVCIDTNG